MTKVSVSLLFTFFSLVLSARAAWASETIDLVIIETLPVPIVTESRVEFEKELARIKNQSYSSYYYYCYYIYTHFWIFKICRFQCF